MKIAKRCVCCEGERLQASPAVLMPFLAHRIFRWEPVEVTPAWNLRDLVPGQAYAVCNTLVCESCELVFLDMRFDDEEMAALYADYRGPHYTSARARFEPGYEMRNSILNGGSPYIPQIEALLAPYVPARARVLDWGGDTGMNTPFRGRTACHHVLDISDKPVVDGAERIERVPESPGHYDLIVSSQVLEHVPYPLPLLRLMAGAMAPETVLYVEIPHEALMRTETVPGERGTAKRHWHEHVNFFSRASVEAMMRRAGLDIVECRSHPVSAGGHEGHIFSVVARRAAAPLASNPL